MSKNACCGRHRTGTFGIVATFSRSESGDQDHHQVLGYQVLGMLMFQQKKYDMTTNSALVLVAGPSVECNHVITCAIYMDGMGRQCLFSMRKGNSEITRQALRSVHYVVLFSTPFFIPELPCYSILHHRLRVGTVHHVLCKFFSRSYLSRPTRPHHNTTLGVMMPIIVCRYSYCIDSGSSVVRTTCVMRV